MLANQKAKIDQEDFDLEAWKSTASALIARIFGNDDPRIKIINDLKIDYGSWALRDASSKYDPVTTCKKKAHDLMEMAAEEIETGEGETLPSLVESSLADYLTGNQIKSLKEITESDFDEKKKRSELIKSLQKLKGTTLPEILASIMLGAKSN